MRHECLDDAESLFVRLARYREVNSLEHAKLAARAQLFKALEIGHGRARQKKCGQQGGIGRHYPVGQRRAAQGQARHAEGRILVSQRVVLPKIGRFRYAPRQLLRAAESPLRGHRGVSRCLQQAMPGLMHQQ